MIQSPIFSVALQSPERKRNFRPEEVQHFADGETRTNTLADNCFAHSGRELM